MSRISEILNVQLNDAVKSDKLKLGVESNHLQMDNAVKTETKEAVNHPSHYQSKTGLEAIDVIEAFDLGFNLGNVVKYILRCGKKDADIQELEKAKWYLEREISNRKWNSCRN